jgi:hypothetical protein
VRIGGEATGTSNAVAYDLSVPASSIVAITTGMTLGSADVVTVRSSVSNALTFSLFGSEID